MSPPAAPNAGSDLAADAGNPSPARLRSPRNALPASGRIGLAVVLFWVLLALLGPSIIPHAPGAIVSTTVFAPMSLRFPLGTDYLGRDMLSRILIGARYTVALALVAAVAASATGTVLGLLAAISGRWADEILSRLLDALICIP
ncbi:MAG: ABC transporter permease, partial [Acetobacteraceae bacterium]